ncbi:MAG: cytochrome c [Planctomycetota bacterium]
MRTLLVIVSILTGSAVLVFAYHDAKKATVKPAHAPNGFERGAELYRQNCAICHGVEGRGDGPAAGVLDPRPRNFELGKYRLGSTTGLFPSRQDILNTIRDGIPGTGMPSWRHLPPADQECMADYCLEVTRRGLKAALIRDEKAESEEEAEEISHDLVTAPPDLQIPPEPPCDQASLATGRAIFAKNCASCHDADGRGRPDPSWRTAEGYPIASRDLRRGVFKGGRGARALYARIYRGIPGTPMPGSPSMTGDETWAVVHYVQSIVNSDLPQQAGR